MDFATHLEKYLPKDEIDRLISSFENEEIKGVLLNTKKMQVETFLNLFPNVRKHPVIPYAFLYNKNEYSLGSNIYHELGAYYIQDPSAMLVSYFLSPTSDDLVLDMCAAPGGKSVGASILMNDDGLLISNDISRSRLDVLLSNAERLGLSNNVVISNDFSKNFKDFPDTFDKIILDAPCSGSGMFRKNEEMKSDWTYEKVIKFSHIQKELILASYYMLKPGGRLIYSTCSYSYEEDEEVVRYLLKETDAKLVPLPRVEGEYRSDMPEAIHLFTSRFNGEGHFIALIEKPGVSSNEDKTEEIITKNSLTKGGKKEKLIFKRKMKLPKGFERFVIRDGLFLEEIIDEKHIPTHAFARSVASDERMVEVSFEDAKKFIAGESLNINKKDGYYFPSYMGLTLGVGHAVNNVLKNSYPKGLRKKII